MLWCNIMHYGLRSKVCLDRRCKNGPGVITKYGVYDSILCCDCVCVKQEDVMDGGNLRIFPPLASRDMVFYVLRTCY